MYNSINAYRIKLTYLWLKYTHNTHLWFTKYIIINILIHLINSIYEYYYLKINNLL